VLIDSFQAAAPEAKTEAVQIQREFIVLAKMNVVPTQNSSIRTSTLDIKNLALLLTSPGTTRIIVIVFPFLTKEKDEHKWHTTTMSFQVEYNRCLSIMILLHCHLKCGHRLTMNPSYAGLLAAEGMKYLFVESSRLSLLLK
jgi:hypothetical protein